MVHNSLGIAIKLPLLLAIFLFPPLFITVGQAAATRMICNVPLCCLLVAIFILPQVYGYEGD